MRNVIVNGGLGGLTLLLVACSVGKVSSPVNNYVLSPLVEFGESEAVGAAFSKRVIIDKVALPTYVERPHMVTRTSPNQLKFAEFDRWAEPLDQGITQVLQQNLRRILGSQAILPTEGYRMSGAIDWRIEVIVDRFEWNQASGQIELFASWRIVSVKSRKDLRADILKVKIPWEPGTDNYSAMAAGMSQALVPLSEALAEALRQL